MTCLYVSPTFRTFQEPALSSSSAVISFSEGDNMSLRGLHERFRNDLFKRHYQLKSIEDCFLILKAINSLEHYLSISSIYSWFKSKLQLTFLFRRPSFLLITLQLTLIKIFTPYKFTQPANAGYAFLFCKVAIFISRMNHQ